MRVCLGCRTRNMLFIAGVFVIAAIKYMAENR